MSKFKAIVPAKKTYYQTRGKVHLVHYQSGEPVEVAEKTWCGMDLGNVNNPTTKVEECTCQKCLMVMTKNWKPREKK